MKFAMVTSFFGLQALGDDATFVDRLSGALARHGHEVHVIFCRNASGIARKDRDSLREDVPSGVTVHPLSSPVGPLSPLATHQTGRPMFKAKAVRALLRSIQPDVVHYHNLSLIGGPGLLSLPAPSAVKLMTAHEHWLVCPTHSLWKHTQSVCETPQCVSCSFQSGVLPQFWRRTNLMERSLDHLDVLIAPSQSLIREHTRRGIARPMTHLPYFLPEADQVISDDSPTPEAVRPYIAAAGRLEKVRGFQDVIAAMRRLPELDFRVAGSGPFGSELRAQAQGMANVHFEGPMDRGQVAALFRGARAVAVPSLISEAFGPMVLEAFAKRTPVVVRDLGALPELIAVSGGGLVFRTEDELVTNLKRVATDDGLRNRLGSAGHAARQGIWSETEHLDRYLGLIQEHRRTRRFRVDRAHGSPASHLRVRSTKAAGSGPRLRPSGEVST